MATRVACPSCQSTLQLPDDFPTRRAIRCPKCEHVFQQTNKNGEGDAEKKAVPAPSAESPPANPFAGLGSVSEKNAGPTDSTASKNTAREKPGARASKAPLVLLLGLSGGMLVLLGAAGATCLVLLLPQLRGDRKPAPDPIASIAKNNPEPSKKDGELKEVAKPADVPGSGLPNALLDEVKQATVLIQVGLLDGRSASGSGFFAGEPGVVLTNAHVVGMLDPDLGAPKQIHVIVRSGAANEEKFDATVIGVERGSDLAVLRIDGKLARTQLPGPLPLARLQNLRETQRVFVLGYPFGEALGKAVTVSESSVSSLRGKNGVLDEIQINGGMHPGNSGGPIIDPDGKVVGVGVAGIPGTQINFAIPARKALELFDGKVAAIRLSDATVRDGKMSVPLKLELLDPLRRLEKVEVHWWWGKPGPDRAASASAPAAESGDTGPKAVALAYQPDKGLATVDLVVDSSAPDGSVFWCRPVLCPRQGSKQYATASGRALAAQPEEKAAMLERKHEAEKHVVNLQIKSITKRLEGAGVGRTITATSQTQLREDIKDAAGPEIACRIQVMSASTSESQSGQNVPLDNGLEKALLEHAILCGFDASIDGQGNLTKLAPEVGSLAKNPDLLHKYLEHVGRGLELAAIPLPGALTKPGTTWQGARLPAMAPMQGPTSVAFDVTYTYRGLRIHENRPAAVIALAGTLRANREFQTGVSVVGALDGQALVDVAAGTVVRFGCELNLTRRSPTVGGSAHEQRQVVEVMLTRSKGFLPPGGPAVAALAGAWCITEFVQSGKLQPLHFEHESWWIIKGDRIYEANNEMAGLGKAMRFRLRPDIGADVLELEMLTGISDGGLGPRMRFYPALFKIEGNQLKLCLSRDNQKPPVAFSSPPNTQTRLYTMERVEGWKSGYTRKAIHIGKLAERPKDGFNDDPGRQLSIDPAPPAPVPPCYDLSKGMENAHVFHFRDATSGAALSPDGKTIACYHNEAVHFYDFASRKLLARAEDSAAAHVMFFTNDASRLVTISLEKKVMRLRQVADGKELLTFDGCPAGQPVLSPGGRYLVSVDGLNPLRVWDTQTGKEIRRVENPQRIARLVYSPDGKHLLGTRLKYMCLFDAVTLKIVKEYSDKYAGFDPCTFSPDGKLIYANLGTKVLAIDRETGATVQEYLLPQPANWALWVSADNKYLVGVHQLTGGKLLRVGEAKPISSARFPMTRDYAHPGRAITLLNTTELVLFCTKEDPAFAGPPPDKGNLEAVAVINAVEKAKLPLPPYSAVAFSPCGEYVAAASARLPKDRSVHVFAAHSGKLVKSIDSSLAQVSGVALSRNAETLFVSGVTALVPFQQLSETYVSVVDLKSEREDRIAVAIPAIRNLWLSPDGGRLFGAGMDYSLRVWDAKSRKPLHSRDKLTRVPQGIEIAPSGKRGVMVIETGPVVFNLDSYQDVLKLPEGTRNLKLLGDTARAVTVSKEVTLKLWDLKTGNLLKSFALAEPTSSCKFHIAGTSPDGRLVHLSGQLPDGDFLQVWDVEAGKVVRRYRIAGGGTVTEMSPLADLAVVRTPKGLSLVELPVK